MVAAGTACHIVWRNIPDRIRARLGPATWSPDGKIANGKIRATAGIVIVCVIFGIAYVGSHWPATSRSATPKQEEAAIAEPIMSRGDKLLFACEIPPPDEKSVQQFPQQLEEFKKNLAVVGDALGITYTVTIIRGGYRIDIEAVSEEIKRNTLMSSGIPGVTTLTFELRRVRKQILISMYANYPENVRQFFSLITPSPDSKEAIRATRQTERILGYPHDACHMI